MADNMHTLTDAEFENAIGTDKPILVDFWAEWCGPCRLVAPVLEELAGEYSGKLTFSKLNIDENPRAAQSSDVMSIPTMVVFKNGVEQKRIVGPRPKHQMIQELADFIG